MARTFLITGVSSGFGYEMTKQLLERGDRVIGTVRNTKKVESLKEKYPNTFDCRILDVTDVPAVQQLVRDSFTRYGRIDVVISNAGYGLFGCVEELSDEEINHIIATNLVGSIQLLKTAVPFMRKQGGGRLIQMSTYGAQVAYAANAMYHATKFGIEGFCEALAQEVAQFNIGVTMVEPGGARTEFRYGSAKVAKLMPEYESCHERLRYGKLRYGQYQNVGCVFLAQRKTMATKSNAGMIVRMAAANPYPSGYDPCTKVTNNETDCRTTYYNRGSH